MTAVTVVLPEALDAQIEARSKAGGYSSKEDCLLALMSADCDQAQLESVLQERFEGPFAPLEPNWKEQVRQAANPRG